MVWFLGIFRPRPGYWPDREHVNEEAVGLRMQGGRHWVAVKANANQRLRG